MIESQMKWRYITTGQMYFYYPISRVIISSQEIIGGICQHAEIILYGTRNNNKEKVLKCYEYN